MDRSYKQLDPLIHQPARLSILAALAVADEVEFATLRGVIDISDSLLSRYTSQLEEVGYITIRKGYSGKRPRTWLSLTDQGRAAFNEHIALLNKIVGKA